MLAPRSAPFRPPTRPAPRARRVARAQARPRRGRPSERPPLRHHLLPHARLPQSGSGPPHLRPLAPARRLRPRAALRDRGAGGAAYAALSARIPLCESSESAAGPRAKRNVGEDDDNYQKSKPSHSHHAGVRNRSRSLRFDPGQCGNGDYGDYEAEPCEPVHDSDFRKIRASRARGIIERLPGAEAFRARACLIQLVSRRPRRLSKSRSIRGLLKVL